MTATIALPDQPFTLAYAAEIGITRRQMYALCAAGAVRRVFHGVYVPSSLPDEQATRLACLRLVTASHQVVVDRTAAIVHEVDALTYAELDGPPPIELCALRGRNRARHDDVDGRTRDLLAADVMIIGGVRVTTPLRTALDLGCLLRRREAFAALCAFARLHGITTAMLLAELPRFRGRRGVVQLRELAQLVDPRFESAREAWTYLAIRDAGLPLPEPQVWIEIDGVPTFRLDLAYRHRRVCIEYDGVDFHERTPAQREHDRRRRAWLRDNGWTVIVIRVGDFTGVSLDRWLGELRSALAPSYSNRRW